MKPRHVSMISMGGIIGAGIFVASSTVIYQAGPAVLLSYFLSVILLILVMRMLGEMAVADPDTGSFATYASKAMSPAAGFSVGWMYWVFWMFTIAVQTTAAAKIAGTIFPGNQGIWAFIFLLLTAGINFLSASKFAETEYVMSFIKIATITVFIIIGLLAIFGLFKNSTVSGIDKLFDDGGFMPNGFKAVLVATLTTSFSFMGAEITTIAAAESKNPEESIRKSISTVIKRILFFYFGSFFVFVSLVSWREYNPDNGNNGPFQIVLERIGIPHSESVMNVLILIALISCLNTSIYTGSRMLYSLSTNKYAPKKLTKLSDQGSPIFAVLVSTFVGLITVIANYLLPDNLFKFLLAIAASLALYIYLCIAISQIILRKNADSNNTELKFKFWAFPYLSYFVVVYISLILLLMLVVDTERTKAIVSAIICLIVILISLVWKKLNRQV